MPKSPKHEVVANLVDLHLSSGDQIRFWVTSNSMYPLIRTRDAVIVEPISPDKINLGDLIVIQRDNDYLTHRIVHKSKIKWLTKGDNNLLPDSSSATDKLIGRVVSIEQREKKIDLQIFKWHVFNPMLAKLSFLEWKAFSIQRYLRLPFRLAIKIIQKVFM